VWARLRRERGVYTSCKRLLRLTCAGVAGPDRAGAHARRAAARRHDHRDDPRHAVATDATEAWSAEGRSADFAIIDHACGEVWTDVDGIAGAPPTCSGK
jgi:hypothetical protein